MLLENLVFEFNQNADYDKNLIRVYYFMER